MKRRRVAKVLKGRRKRRKSAFVRRPASIWPQVNTNTAQIIKIQRAEELKFFDLVSSVTAASGGAGAVVLCNNVRVGTGASNRIGVKYMIKSISMVFTVGAADAETHGVGVRVAMVYDRAPRGVATTWDSIFSTKTALG